MPAPLRRSQRAGSSVASASTIHAAQSRQSSARRRPRPSPEAEDEDAGALSLRDSGSHKKRRRDGAEETGSRVELSTRGQQPNSDVDDEGDDDDEIDEELEGGEEVEGGDIDDDEDSDGGADVWGLKPMKRLAVSEACRKVGSEMNKEDLKRKANDLVRLALFSEYRRSLLKRDEITKKVLGKTYSRVFPIIFNRAQKVLRFTFGYEMVEVRARGTDNDQILTAQSQRRREPAGGADGEAERAKGTSSKTYIVASILPEKLIARITQPEPVLAEAVNHVSGQGAGLKRDSDGVLLDWKCASSELGSMGLTYLILSVILLNGRVLADDQLRSYLRKFGLGPGAPLPMSLQPHPETLRRNDGITIEDFLSTLVKQNYLERIRIASAQATSASIEASLAGRRTQARGNVRRNRNGDAEIVEEFEWRWGARAEAEITEKAVAAFVTDVFIGAEEEEQGLQGEEANDVGDSSGDEEANGQDNDEHSVASRRKRRKAQLQRDIERVAGSALIS